MIPLKDNIPTDRFPVVTVALIVINIVMFFGFQGARWADGGGFQVDDQNSIEYAEIPYELSHPGKLCGGQAIVDGQRIDTEGQPLCEGATEQFTDTRTGATVTAGNRRVGMLSLSGNKRRKARQSNRAYPGCGTSSASIAREK